MTLQEQLDTYGIKILRQPDTGRLFYNESGGPGAMAGIGEITDPQAFLAANPGISITDVNSGDFNTDNLAKLGVQGVNTSKSNYSYNGFLNKVVTGYDQRATSTQAQAKQESDAKAVNDFIAANKNTPGIIDVPNMPGYVIKDGVFTTRKAVDDTAYWEDQVSKGLAKKVPIGNGFGYVPTGSPADLAMQGKTFDQQMATPSVQQFVKDNNLNPVSPTQPVVPQGGTTPQGLDFNSVLQNVYNSRPDLQAIYNPDGSKKDPNNPSPATLADWGRTFGAKESPLIKQALSQPTSPSGSSPAGSTTPAAPGGTSGGAVGQNIPSSTTDNPVQRYVNNYKSILKELGLPDLKTNIDQVTKEYNDVQNELNDKITEINNDPWLVQGVKEQRIKKEQDRYEGKLKIKENYLTLMQNMYTQGLNEANQIAGEVDAQIKMDADAAQRAADASQKALEANQNLVLDYGVSKPFYTIDGQTIIRTSDGKVYGNLSSWQADGGRPELVENIGNRTPISKKSSGTPSGIPDSKVATYNQVRDWIQAAKVQNPGVAYYDLWGQLADKLRSEYNLNPANYDKAFWEVLSPEGLAGYQKYVTKSGSSGSGTDIYDQIGG